MMIVVYEEKVKDFYPLINYFPQHRLRIGGQTIVHHLLRSLPRAPMVFMDRFSDRITRSVLKDTVVYISARFIPTQRIVIPRHDTVLINNDQPIGLVCHGPAYPDTLPGIRRAGIRSTRKIVVKGYALQRIWDLIRYNSEILEKYFETLKKPVPASRKTTILGKRKYVHVSPRARINEGVVLDTSDGPIIVDATACIRPFTTIIGPVYIGEGTIVDRAKVLASTIGPVCRISGEVEGSIFQGYGNKHHEGFIGHSFLGEWVNLGAMTTNSDLKNTYGPVRVRIGRARYDTGMTKLGCFIGDHTKTGIGTLIPTGAVIGSFVNFFGGGMMPQYVKDFRWLSTRRNELHLLKKALETARTTMQRRDVTMTQDYVSAIKSRYRCRDS